MDPALSRSPISGGARARSSAQFVERLILKIAFLGLVFLVRAIRKPGGGLWGVVGTLAFIFLGQKRSLATVDEYGNTGIQRL